MYDDFYMYDEIEVYIYECEICKSRVKSRSILECIICKKRLCANNSCNVGDFCSNHYELLSPEGKKEFNNTVKEEKQDIQYSNFGCYCSFAIISFIFFLLTIELYTSFTIDNNKYDNYMDILLFGLCLGVISIIVFIVYNFKINQKSKHYSQAKLKIYVKYRKIE